MWGGINREIVCPLIKKPAGGLPPALGAIRRNCSAYILKSVELSVTFASGHIPPDDGTRPDVTFEYCASLLGQVTSRLTAEQDLT